MSIDRPKSKQPIPPHAKKVFSGVLFNVYQWEQELHDGTTKTFEKAERPDTVNIVPVTKEGLILVSYEEQSGEDPFIGIAGGRVDKGEDILEAAKRELKEETGYEAEEWMLLEAVQPIPKLEWVSYTFLAKKCEKTGESTPDAGERIELRAVGFDEFVRTALCDPDYRDVEITLMFARAQCDPGEMEKLRKLFLS